MSVLQSINQVLSLEYVLLIAQFNPIQCIVLNIFSTRLSGYRLNLFIIIIIIIIIVIISLVNIKINSHRYHYPFFIKVFQLFQGEVERIYVGNTNEVWKIMC